jgi:hypothetical protein
MRTGGPLYDEWIGGFKGGETPKRKEKEIRRLEDEAVIRLARRGLLKEAEDAKPQMVGLIESIMRALRDESIWPSFAKACREEHFDWLFWCMERSGEGDGDGEDEGEDEGEDG